MVILVGTNTHKSERKPLCAKDQFSKRSCLLVILVFTFGGGVQAGEIIYADDIRENVINSAVVVDAMKKLPADPSGRTPLAKSLTELGFVLDDLSGKSIVYIFSDGGYDRVAGTITPGAQTTERAEKCDLLPSDRLRRAKKGAQDGIRYGAGQCMLAGYPIRLIH